MFVFNFILALAFIQCVRLSDATNKSDYLQKFYRNDYKYNVKANGWLKYHRIPATWHEARLRCKAEGAVLASPLNIGILNSMKEIMENGFYLETHSMFIGIHATISKGDFLSVEGIPVSNIPLLRYSSICHEVVNNLKDIPKCLGDCMIMGKDGGVHTADCNLMLPYMCYKEESEIPLSVCGASNFDYTYEERTKSCYKFHTIGRTWRRAFMTCLNEGAHLVILNSDLEAQVIKELLTKYPPSKLFAHYSHVASIGALDWGERGSWWTIHGETLQEAGYSTWDGNGMPDSPKIQFCVGINRTGKLNDIECDISTFAFICEKKPINFHNIASGQLDVPSV